MSHEQELRREHERIDDLQLHGYQIIQNPAAFCFGMDAVLLAHFVKILPKDHVVDLCTGTGIIPLLLCGHTKAKHVTGYEIQADMVEMARRSVQLNDLTKRIDIEQKDICTMEQREFADCVTCNPPYYKKNAAQQSKNRAQAMARYEVVGTLSEYVHAAGRIVRNGGRVAFIHRSERFLELCDSFRQAYIEPKRMQWIQATKHKAPHLVLLEGVKLAKPGLLLLPTRLLDEEHIPF